MRDPGTTSNNGNASGRVRGLVPTWPCIEGNRGASRGPTFRDPDRSSAATPHHNVQRTVVLPQVRPVGSREIPARAWQGARLYRDMVVGRVGQERPDVVQRTTVSPGGTRIIVGVLDAVERARYLRHTYTTGRRVLSHGTCAPAAAVGTQVRWLRQRSPSARDTS
jgi:hypothetical protein